MRRDIVLGVIAIVVGIAAWTLSKRGAKREGASRFKSWYPEK